MDKVKGLIKGCAVGDAFGMATEMMTRKYIKEEIGTIEIPIKSFPNSIISQKQPAGSITDDTFNSLMILEMLIESKGRIDVELYIDKLRKWSRNSPIASFVTGPSTSKALSLIEEGVPISETGKMGTTNGAAMKISPLGIVLDYRDLENLVEKVALICTPTHNTTIAISGAAIIAAISSYALRGGRNWEEIWNLVIEVENESKKYGYNWPTASLVYRIFLAKSIVEEEKNVDIVLTRLYEEIGAGVETIETIPSALAIAYMAKGDPMKSAQLSAIIGGDTDTIGSIATALCGAMNPDFSESIIEQIEDVNELSFEEIFKNSEILTTYILD